MAVNKQATKASQMNNKTIAVILVYVYDYCSECFLMKVMETVCGESWCVVLSHDLCSVLELFVIACCVSVCCTAFVHGVP